VVHKIIRQQKRKSRVHERNNGKRGGHSAKVNSCCRIPKKKRKQIESGTLANDYKRRRESCSIETEKKTGEKNTRAKVGTGKGGT